MVKYDEVVEFFKLIKKSDYMVVDQLHQTPSKISILSLILKYEAHIYAFLNVFSQANVTKSIMIDQFDGVVSNITSCNTLSLSNDELPEEGQVHNHVLHIAMKFRDDVLA